MPSDLLEYWSSLHRYTTASAKLIDAELTGASQYSVTTTPQENTSASSVVEVQAEGVAAQSGVTSGAKPVEYGTGKVIRITKTLKVIDVI